MHQVGGGIQSVTDSLSKFIAAELLSGDNRWFCETCDTKVRDAAPQVLHGMHVNVQLFDCTASLLGVGLCPSGGCREESVHSKPAARSDAAPQAVRLDAPAPTSTCCDRVPC